MRIKYIKRLDTGVVCIGVQPFNQSGSGLVKIIVLERRQKLKIKLFEIWKSLSEVLLKVQY